MNIYRHLSAIVAFLFLVWGGRLEAQQQGQTSLWLTNPFGYNPAYAGLSAGAEAHAVYRQQWSGLTGNPQYHLVDAQLPLLGGMSGLGFKAENQSFGAHRFTRAGLGYAHHLRWSRSIRLSAGALLGYQQYMLDGSVLRTPQGLYQDFAGLVDHRDDQISVSRLQVGGFTVEVGGLVEIDGFQFGASIQPVYTRVVGGGRLRPLWIATGSYRYQAGDQWSVQSGVLLRADARSKQAELTVLGGWSGRVDAGFAYRGWPGRGSDALVMLGGLRINERSKLFYAYDLPLSSLAAAHQGSHEVLLKYALMQPIGKGKIPPIIYNPRFF